MITIKSAFYLCYTTICFWLVANSPPSFTIHPIWVFVGSTAAAMLAGQGALWRSKREVISTRDVVSHLLNMGTCGASLSMLLYAWLYPRENLELYIIGSVGLISLGGMTMIDMVAEWSGGMIKRLLSKDGK